jgi:transposase
VKNKVENPPIDEFTLLQMDYEKLRSEYTYLKQELAQLKRMIYGSQSERFIPTDTGQASLFDSADPEQVAPPPALPKPQDNPTEKKTTQKPAKKKPVRMALPAHLPRQREVIAPENLSADAKKIGEELTEILEYTPGTLYVRSIVRPKYVISQKEGVLIADLPSLPLPKANAGAGLLAHIQVSKFVDHLPFYRQINRLKRQGVSLASSTLNNWFNNTCTLLEPLYNCLENKVLTSTYLQADESPIKVQDNHKKGSTHNGYQWLYLAPQERRVLFKYSPSRARTAPEGVLKNFSGLLQTDGYIAYNHLKTKGTITLAACMAHARRKFDQAKDNDQARAQHVLALMQKLYEVERQAREQSMDANQRQALRQQEALPVLDELEQYLADQLQRVAPKSAIGQALNYTVNLWPRLKRYAQDGRQEIDNNLIENQVRPLAIGRKNYLFAGSHQAAQNAAMMYSFFGTCKLQGVEPLYWLTDTLKRIQEHKANKLYKLLPGFKQ